VLYGFPDFEIYAISIISIRDDK